MIHDPAPTSCSCGGVLSLACFPLASRCLSNRARSAGCGKQGTWKTETRGMLGRAAGINYMAPCMAWHSTCAWALCMGLTRHRTHMHPPSLPHFYVSTVRFTCVTVTLSFCLGVLSPCRTTANTQRSSSCTHASTPSRFD